MFLSLYVSYGVLLKKYLTSVFSTTCFCLNHRSVVDEPYFDTMVLLAGLSFYKRCPAVVQRKFWLLFSASFVMLDRVEWSIWSDQR